MYKLIRRADTKSSAWSGGTTTQLAIWPQDGDYAARKFIWRVSSARVEAEESEFTSLPGISRCLMILDGELRLSHEGHYETELSRFGQDNFDGGWKTVSRGRVTDFNLMTSEGEGRVQIMEVSAAERAEVRMFPLAAGWGEVSEVFYFLSDGITLADPDGVKSDINAGDVFMTNTSISGERYMLGIENSSEDKAEIVRAVIYHN